MTPLSIQLSGIWDGVCYEANINDSTRPQTIVWRNCEIYFGLHSNGTGSINGRGTSQTDNSPTKPFLLRGQVKWPMARILFVCPDKIPNEKKFILEISINQRPSMRGKHSLGTLQLHYSSSAPALQTFLIQSHYPASQLSSYSHEPQNHTSFRNFDKPRNHQQEHELVGTHMMWPKMNNNSSQLQSFVRPNALDLTPSPHKIIGNHPTPKDSSFPPFLSYQTQASRLAASLTDLLSNSDPISASPSIPSASELPITFAASKSTFGSLWGSEVSSSDPRIPNMEGKLHSDSSNPTQQRMSYTEGSNISNTQLDSAPTSASQKHKDVSLSQERSSLHNDNPHHNGSKKIDSFNDVPFGPLVAPAASAQGFSGFNIANTAFVSQPKRDSPEQFPSSSHNSWANSVDTHQIANQTTSRRSERSGYDPNQALNQTFRSNIWGRIDSNLRNTEVAQSLSSSTISRAPRPGRFSPQSDVRMNTFSSSLQFGLGAVGSFNSATEAHSNLIGLSHNPLGRASSSNLSTSHLVSGDNNRSQIGHNSSPMHFPVHVPSTKRHSRYKSIDHMIRSLYENSSQGMKYLKILRQNDVDLESLLLMNESHLKEMGLPLGPRVKIMDALGLH